MRHLTRWSLCLLALVALVPSCSEETATTPSPTSPAAYPEEMGLYSGFQVGGAKLALSTTGPAQYYVGPSPDPWLRFSVVTQATDFTLRVTNLARKPVAGLSLLVAIPSDLPEYGWSVTLGYPGLVFSRPEDFPETRLEASDYPDLPHGIYDPEGNARFVILSGPAVLGAGSTWEIPVQLYRGMVEGFRVHFDATAGHCFSSPWADLTALPPMQEDLEPPPPPNGGLE